MKTNEIRKTLVIGQRIEAGKGDDREAGVVMAIEGDQVTVGWDSEHRTTQSLEALGLGDEYILPTRTNASEIGLKIGAAMARDVMADDLAREWTGINDQDGDQLTAAGIEPDSQDWQEAISAAQAEYERVLGQAAKGGI